jgi:IgGFc binding protein
MPLGTSGKYEFAWVKLTDQFTPQSFGDRTCAYGRHEMHSNGPFSVTVWGVDKYASYGFVGGTGLRPIHTAPPPTVN